VGSKSFAVYQISLQLAFFSYLEDKYGTLQQLWVVEHYQARWVSGACLVCKVKIQQVDNSDRQTSLWLLAGTYLPDILFSWFLDSSSDVI
jgi:hypothetical protein